MDAVLRQIIAALPEGVRPIAEANMQAMLVALVAVAVSILLLAVNLTLGGSKGNTAVLVGTCNSGKTTLFYQLLNGTAPDCGTVASMQENTEQITCLNAAGAKSGPTITCIDVPGHERLRHKLERHLNDARCIIFVVDAADITPSKVEAAEELFQVLTHPSVHKRRPPILLACNKMDLETQAHSVEFVRRTLEKQLEVMRKTQSAISKEAAQKASLLGPADKPFSLAGVRNSVTVASISGLKGDVAEVHSFLRTAMK